MGSDSRSSLSLKLERCALPPGDPWAVASSLGTLEGAYVCLEKKEWIFGFGVVQQTADLDQARSWALSGAHVLGARAFDPSVPMAGPWEGWSRERWFVPEICLRFSARAVEAWGKPAALAAAKAKWAKRRSTGGFSPVWPEELRASSVFSEGSAQWETLHRAALEHIRAGGFSKVVIARSIELPPGGVEPLSALRRASEQFPSCTAFWVKGPDGVFLGATPETLATVQGASLKTEAFAGSAAPGQGEWLLRSGKERREHQAVVEGVLTALAPFARRIRAAKSPELVHLSNIVHLRTPIEAELKDANQAPAAVLALHPTPAVNGLPKDPARHFLKERELLDRGLYAGILGHLFEDRMELKVALRSALLRSGGPLLFVGAGIVEGSDCRAEWEETERKAQAMRWALLPESEAEAQVSSMPQKEQRRLLKRAQG